MRAIKGQLIMYTSQHVSTGEYIEIPWGGGSYSGSRAIIILGGSEPISTPFSNTIIKIYNTECSLNII